MKKLIYKKTGPYENSDEFVIYNNGKIKDRRVKPSVCKRLKKQHYVTLRKMLRDNAEYLEKNICDVNDEYVRGALYINARTFMPSGVDGKTTARVINWIHEKEIYDLIDQPDNKILLPNCNSRKKKKRLNKAKEE